MFTRDRWRGRRGSLAPTRIILRMRRRVVKLLLFLLAGAIINIAVAWGCVINAERSWRHQPLIVTHPKIWQTPVPDDWPLPQVGIESVRFGFSRKINSRGLFELSSGLPMRMTHIVVITECGFPKRTLTSVVRSPSILVSELDSRRAKTGCSLDSGVLVHRENVSNYVPLPGEWNYEEWLVMPLRPLWWGFAINTLIYAAILWILWAAPGPIRRAIRHRRGQCPACGYPVGASPVCTECGKPVTPRAVGSDIEPRPRPG